MAPSDVTLASHTAQSLLGRSHIQLKILQGKPTQLQVWPLKTQHAVHINVVYPIIDNQIRLLVIGPARLKDSPQVA